MENIEIEITLSAYTKALLEPAISEAPNDGNTYARKNKGWVVIDSIVSDSIGIDENSLLTKTITDSGVTLGTKIHLSYEEPETIETGNIYIVAN